MEIIHERAIHVFFKWKLDRERERYDGKNNDWLILILLARKTAESVKRVKNGEQRIFLISHRWAKKFALYIYRTVINTWKSLNDSAITVNGWNGVEKNLLWDIASYEYLSREFFCKIYGSASNITERMRTILSRSLCNNLEPLLHTWTHLKSTNVEPDAVLFRASINWYYLASWISGLFWHGKKKN